MVATRSQREKGTRYGNVPADLCSIAANTCSHATQKIENDLYHNNNHHDQIPGGYLIKRFGGKNTLALSFLLWSPLSAALAASTRAGYSVSVVLACRLGIGLAQGIFLPAAHSVLGHWTPQRYQGRQFAFAMSGMFAGAALAMVTVPTVGAC